MHCVDNHAFNSEKNVHFSELYPEAIYINTVLLTSAAHMNKQKHILLPFALLKILDTVGETRFTLFCGGSV